jgi:hypothetical protein
MYFFYLLDRSAYYYLFTAGQQSYQNFCMDRLATEVRRAKPPAPIGLVASLNQGHFLRLSNIFCSSMPKDRENKTTIGLCLIRLGVRKTDQ